MCFVFPRVHQTQKWKGRKRWKRLDGGHTPHSPKRQGPLLSPFLKPKKAKTKNPNKRRKVFAKCVSKKRKKVTMCQNATWAHTKTRTTNALTKKKSTLWSKMKKKRAAPKMSMTTVSNGLLSLIVWNVDFVSSWLRLDILIICSIVFLIF